MAVLRQRRIIIRESVKRVACRSVSVGTCQEIIQHLVASGIVLCHNVKNAAHLFLEAVPPKLMKVDCLSEFLDALDRDE